MSIRVIRLIGELHTATKNTSNKRRMNVMYVCIIFRILASHVPSSIASFTVQSKTEFGLLFVLLLLLLLML